MTPQAAYVHVPFCKRRCGYCNFTVAAGRDDLFDRFLDALEMELSQSVDPRPVQTLFFGGGTPTYLPARQLDRLLRSVSHWFPLTAGHEFTVEANPVDVTASLVAMLTAHRVNRISLGAQSFQESKLQALDRDHTADDIARGYAIAVAAFRSVSLDLIFAAPGETLEGWLKDVAMAVRLNPRHISCYGLTYERGTSLWSRRMKGQVRPVAEEAERAMYEHAIELLRAAGLEHYEVSNFARAGFRCRHNEVYWAGEPYFAVGPGAARYVNGRREVNHRSTTTYIRRVLAGESPVAESETLGPEDRAREMLVLGLRRLAGVNRVAFAQRSGFEIDTLVGNALSRQIARGVLQDTGDTVRLTREGLFVSDSIWPHFLRV